MAQRAVIWLADSSELIKIRLQNRGEDLETAWAEDLGPHGSASQARRVRLGNVPFLHAKPTYGDVIVVEPDPDDGFLSWDRCGVEFENIGSRIEKDDGRWAMIIDYRA